MFGVLLPILLTLHVGVCVLLIIVVLMQRPRSEGLGAAFGGGMTENIFGAQTSHVLAKFTTYLGMVFFALTLLLAVVYAKASTGRSNIQKELEVISNPLKIVPPAKTMPAASPLPTVEEQSQPSVSPDLLDALPESPEQQQQQAPPLASPTGS